MTVLFGEVIGKGTERVCYINKKNPKTCFKVSRRGHSKQTLREAKYFEYLKRNNVVPTFMPKYIGFYEEDDLYILEQERIGSGEHETVKTIKEFISEATEIELKQLERVLDNLKCEMIQLNVIVSDMRTTNGYVVLYKGEIDRVVFFDGYGAPEFIPLANIFSWAGKRKIQRQWNKFLRYYHNDLKMFAKNKITFK
jgi:hypothetical protein